MINSALIIDFYLFRYQNFADSLEGRGNDLLVDFSRTPRLPAVDENDDTKANGVGKKGTAKNVKKGVTILYNFYFYKEFYNKNYRQ